MNKLKILTAVTLLSLITSGCTAPAGNIQVIGDTSVESRVTTEEYAPNFSTESAAEAEPEKKEASRADTSSARQKEQEEREGISASDPSRRTMTDDVNLREGPSTDDVILGIVPKGAHVSLQHVEGEWYYVRYMEYYGYVKSGFFEEGDEDENSEYRLSESDVESEDSDTANIETENTNTSGSETEETTETSSESASSQDAEVAKVGDLEVLQELNVTRMVRTTINLRDPEDPEQILTIVPAGDTVLITAALEDDWYFVEYKEISGIIKGGFFTEDNS